MVGNDVKKNVLVCVPWKAEPKRRASVQVVDLAGDSKKRAWGRGRMRQIRGKVNVEVHIIRFAALTDRGSVLQGPSRK